MSRRRNNPGAKVGGLVQPLGGGSIHRILGFTNTDECEPLVVLRDRESGRSTVYTFTCMADKWERVPDSPYVGETWYNHEHGLVTIITVEHDDVVAERDVVMWRHLSSHTNRSQAVTRTEAVSLFVEQFTFAETLTGNNGSGPAPSLYTLEHVLPMVGQVWKCKFNSGIVMQVEAALGPHHVMTRVDCPGAGPIWVPRHIRMCGPGLYLDDTALDDNGDRLRKKYGRDWLRSPSEIQAYYT